MVDEKIPIRLNDTFYKTVVKTAMLSSVQENGTEDVCSENMNAKRDVWNN